MLKKTFPSLLKRAFDNNNTSLTVNPASVTTFTFANITGIGSKVRCYYPSPKHMEDNGFWTRKSPVILKSVLHQLPPPKIYTAEFLLDLFSQVHTDYGNGYKTVKYISR